MDLHQQPRLASFVRLSYLRNQFQLPFAESGGPIWPAILQSFLQPWLLLRFLRAPTVSYIVEIVLRFTNTEKWLVCELLISSAGQETGLLSGVYQAGAKCSLVLVTEIKRFDLFHTASDSKLNGKVRIHGAILRAMA